MGVSFARPTTDPGATLVTDAELLLHTADTTGVHGITDTSVLLTATTGAPISAINPGNQIVYLGDSITAGSNDNANNTHAESWPLWASLLSGGQLYVARNAGVPGDTTANMITRYTTDVTPYSPSTVVLCAGVNDIGQSVSFATFKANIRSLVALIRADGAAPVICTIPPNESATPTGRKATIVLWNHWLRRYAATESIPIVDFYGALVEAADGTYIDAYRADATHPNEAGQKVMAQAFVDQMQYRIPSYRPPLIQDAADTTVNLFASNGLSLTDTNADGVPDGWIAYGGSSGYTHALVTDAAVPGKMIQITQNANASLRIVERGISTGFSVGDTLAVGCVVTSNGGVKADVKLDYVNSSPGRSAFAARFTGSVTRGVVYSEFVIPAGTTTVNVDLIANAGTGVVAWGQITLLNLTTLNILTI